MAVHRRVRVLLGISGLCVALALSACGGGDGSQNAQRQGPSDRAPDNSVVLIADQDPGNWDITSTGLAAIWQWLPSNVLEPLVVFDDKGEPQPRLAESWDISADRTSYTFRLRKNVTFHNGKPLTAQDAAFSLEKYWKSPNASRNVPLQAITSITVVDASTFTVKLSHPSQLFWREMGHIGGTVFEQSSFANISKQPVGTGPYVFAEYKPDDHVTLKANPTYWGTKPTIQTVEIRYITDGGAALNALESGEADGYPFMPQALWERVKTDGFDKKYSLKIGGAGGQVTYAAFNSRNAPYDNQEYRQALARAIDRSAYAQALGADWAVSTTCTFATTEKPYFKSGDKDCALPYNVNNAKAALSEAGKSNPTVKFSFLPNDGISDILAAQLEEAGVTVQREQLELARYSQLILAGKPPQFELTEINTPRDIWQFSCPNPAKANWHSFCDPDMTAVLAKADRATTFAERDQYLAEAAKILQEKAVIIPILATKAVSLIHPDMTGWTAPQTFMEVNLPALRWNS